MKNGTGRKRRNKVRCFAAVLWTLALLSCGCRRAEQTEEPPADTTALTETGSPAESAATSVAAETENEESQEEVTMKMNVQIGNSAFTATLENNAAVDALVEMMEAGPVVIEMSDYSGFEKVGSLGTSLPTSDSRITTQAGDIVLYNANQIAIFYGSNSWSYTRIGKIDDLSGWAEALGSGDVAVTFGLDG